jgi:hypothetical protein
MILLNFTHPITSEQTSQIENLTGERLEQVIDIPVQFDNQQDFLPQMQALLEDLPLNPQQLQTLTVLVNPPSLNVITAMLLAELHGRMGYFPPILRLRPRDNGLAVKYEMAEVINLQAMRDQARKKR